MGFNLCSSLISPSSGSKPAQHNPVFRAQTSPAAPSPATAPPPHTKSPKQKSQMPATLPDTNAPRQTAIPKSQFPLAHSPSSPQTVPENIPGKLPLRKSPP